MPRQAIKWIKSHPKKVVALLLLVLMFAINAVAYMHARAMTHFTSGGGRTPRPEEMAFAQKLRVLFTGVNIPRPENAVTPTTARMKYDAVRFPSTDGIELEAWHIPAPHSRSLVLLFHGYSAAKSQLLAEARAFHDFGHDVLMVDFRGSGGSTGHVTTVGVREADDVASAFDFAKTRWPEKQLVLFGHSMGSAAILRALAIREMHPVAAIVESPFDRMLSTVQNRFQTMKVPSFPLAQLLVFWGGAQHGFNGFAHNPIDYAARVSCPVLLLNGQDDARVTQAEAESVHAQLAGPKALHLFSGAGHGSCCEVNPAEWKQVVRAFLGKHLDTSTKR